MVNKSLQAEIKKKKCAQENKSQTNQETKNPKTVDCQASRCSLKKKSPSLNGIAPTTGTICLFNILAKNEFHEALLTLRD